MIYSHMGSCKVVLRQIIRSKQFLYEAGRNSCLVSSTCSSSGITIITTQRSLHNGSSSTWRESVEEELGVDFPKEGSSVCIYKIPPTMLQPETRAAFEPSILSIGPYHHGVARLQAMEKIKREVFRSIFSGNREMMNSAMDVVESWEEEARNCYSEKIGLRRDQFLKMMLIDGCYVIELLKGSTDIKRWMLPALRRDLIMLENQLPLFVLRKLFDVTTRNISSSCSSSITLEELAFSFLCPLLQGDSEAYSKIYSTASNNIHQHHKHLLDLFRNIILPAGNISRGNQIHMIRSIRELKDAGIKIMAGRNLRPMEISLTDMSLFGGKLTIPQLYLDDRKGTLYRNLVAFEKCHRGCSPDVTSYLFFFDGLINSAEDVELLHYNDVLHHSFGCDSEVAKFINNICRKIGRDASQSYLYAEVGEANSHCRSFCGKIRVRLVRHYFSSWVVGLSTLAAVLALYLSFIQTTTAIHSVEEALKNKGYFHYIKHPILVPLIQNFSVGWEINPSGALLWDIDNFIYVLAL